ncbi:MAG: XRE family transcriptional regulator [Flavobacteriia bacterium]|nr:XRE family transcriptional regulator [Flavobacteriia bacterium]
MEIHLGQLIKAQLEASGMKKSEFARRINRTPQNVFDVFQRKSLDTALLENISVRLRLGDISS